MTGAERKTHILIALALTAIMFVASAMVVHVNYSDMDGDRFADALRLPRSSLAIAVWPTLGFLYFALIDVFLPLGRGKIAMLASFATGSVR